MGYSASPIFLLHGNPDKIVPKHNKFLNSSESYAIPYFSQRLCRWGGFRLMPPKDGISPLTCTIFDLIYFGTILRNQISHISPTSLKKFIMGNYLDFALKIAHRGNTGSHKGKRKLACLPENYICALLLFFSVFGLWHKANSAHFSGSYEKICSQIKKLTCNCSFSELTSHTTKAIRKSFVSPVFCRMYPSP